jgi:hypothetical protein
MENGFHQKRHDGIHKLYLLQDQDIISMMVQAITNKNTVFRSEIDFVFVIWSKIRPACTIKNLKEMIVRSMMINNFVWRFLIENRSRETIDNISGREKNIFPKLLWKFRM